MHAGSLERAPEGAVGPLSGLRVVEFAGIGPAPFCAMLLADLGADVVRILRPGGNDAGVKLPPEVDVYNRNKRLVLLDLKSADHSAVAMQLVRDADVLIEGYRPGVMERLGLGPDECHAANMRLIYGRITGWGRRGARTDTAGHDLTYLAITGALQAIGPVDGPPSVPLNLIGDLGGGALYLAVGILAALFERRVSGLGQVVDTTIVDGVSHLMGLFHALEQTGRWTNERGHNFLDGGAPYYRVYRTADDRFIAVGAIEPRFYAKLLEGLKLDARDQPAQDDVSTWPLLHDRIASVFAGESQSHWASVFADTDACVAPVLSLSEARDFLVRDHGSFYESGGVLQPAIAPVLSRTPGAVRHGARAEAEAVAAFQWLTNKIN